MKRIALAIITSITISIPLCTRAQESKCPGDDNGSADDAAAILQRLKPSATDSEEKQCIEHAINLLAQRREITDRSVLIPYLTFKHTPTREEQNGFYLHPPSDVSEYPAISALALEGKPVRKLLVDTIVGDVSQEIRQNATKALLLSFQPSKGESAASGITLLKTAAHNQTGRGEAHLSEAIRFGLTLRYCTQIHDECEKAAAQ